MKKKTTASSDLEDVRREEMSGGRRPVSLETKRQPEELLLASTDCWKLARRKISPRLCAL
jgi:hypothetical protein